MSKPNNSLLCEYSNWASENPGTAAASAFGALLGAYALYKADEKFLKGTVANTTTKAAAAGCTQLANLRDRCRKTKGGETPQAAPSSELGDGVAVHDDGEFKEQQRPKAE